MPTREDALALFPEGYTPSEKEIEKKLEQLIIAYQDLENSSYEYSEAIEGRKLEYPSLEQQLDLLFKDIDNNAHMYFVHSYEFVPEDKNLISATTDYSSNIVCSVEKDNIFGTQFHPEKSDKTGLKRIDNFINL